MSASSLAIALRELLPPADLLHVRPLIVARRIERVESSNRTIRRCGWRLRRRIRHVAITGICRLRDRRAPRDVHTLFAKIMAAMKIGVRVTRERVHAAVATASASTVGDCSFGKKCAQRGNQNDLT